MNIAIIGSGNVGLITGACFADVGNKVICYDIDVDKIKKFNDGKIDIVVNNTGGLGKIYINTIPVNHSWLIIDAINPEYNRQDIGANVTVYTELHEITKPVISGSSFLSSNDIRLHFGLGDASIVQNVKVRWADGIEEDFGTFKVNQQVKLEKGKSTFN